MLKSMTETTSTETSSISSEVSSEVPAEILPSESQIAPQITPQTQTLSTLAVSESRFLNRELSWLSFNERVLTEARDPRNPLLERLKYAAICGSNLDEFFMVRTAGIHRQIAAGVTTPSMDGLTPQSVLKLLRNITKDMQHEIEKATSDILQALETEGIRFSRVAELDDDVAAKVLEYYRSSVHMVLTPLTVDQAHPFPYISNLSLNMGVLLRGRNKKEHDFVRLKVPLGVIPRVVNIDGHLLLLEEIMAAHLGTLFKGREIIEACMFRVTRNTDWAFEEEEAEDLLVTIEAGLLKRRFGAVVRLEIDRQMSDEMLNVLVENLKVARDDILPLQGPLGGAKLMSLPVDRPDLSFPDYTPAITDLLESEDSAFDLLRRQDILLHHPYDSFVNVLNLLEEAANDPNVLAIKHTLYRTGDDRRLLNALRTAAENGKQVVAMIELKARFDEKMNIAWAKKLERAGAHVVYGIPGFKIHAKTLLIVRREADGVRSYVHIGTGNYNPKTARLYTDLGIMTSNSQIGADTNELFNHLTAAIEPEYHHLLVAPDTARSGLEELIEREISHAKAGKEAWVFGKCNQLTDRSIIEALYRASEAGVRVDMVVRGVCCLRPEVEGLSENIRVQSLLGRYLEHSRIYAFGNLGNPDVYFGSADLMSRNLTRRVEVIAPVLDADHRAAFLSILDTEWNDQRGSWRLCADGVYRKIAGEQSAQQYFALQRQEN